MVSRCEWGTYNKLIKQYHDKEWGVPNHYDNSLFEFLILEGIQAGLSWNTILQKRENYRKALDHFDYNKIASYREQKIEEFMNNSGIIRN